nr:WG repeat-containing protein [Moraxella sp. ZY210820]
MDKTSKIVIPIQYDLIGRFSNDVAIIIQNGKYGLMYKNGSIIIPIEYDGIGEVGFSVHTPVNIHKNGKAGFISLTSGKIVIPLKYESLSDFDMYGEKAWVKLNGEEFYIDKTGKRID